MADTRRITIETPLGDDALLLRGFTGQEGLSQLFHFHLDLISENPAIPFDRMLRQRVTLRMALADGGYRYIHGVVSRFAQSGRDTRVTHYEAEVVPWLWFLTLRQDCRIFQDQCVPDIVTTLFEELGFYDYRNALEGDFPRQDYCVQYQETDFHFISRLMEQHGVFYFFEHQRDKHTLVLANAPSVHKPCPGQPRVRYAQVVGELKHEDMITAWRMEQALRPGAYAMTDYNFESPGANLTVQAQNNGSGGGHRTYERFFYPGGYRERTQGERLVQLCMEEENTSHQLVHGESTCRAFAPGYKFDLVEHYREDINTAYVLTEVHHHASLLESYGSETAWGAGTYSNSFTCLPLRVPYRPPHQTPLPRVQGPQTAFVVGPEGEELYVDKYGRVKVQFLWDRQGQWNERSSCWLRVAQSWAGTNWGAMFLPRVGQEVIVDFLDGDPDRPIITGRVYNARAMPPFDLPRHQEWSGFMSNRLGGGGCHALVMDDRTKRMLLQSQGDMEVLTDKDHYQMIQGTKRENVGQNVYMHIGKEIVIDVGVGLTLKAAGGFIRIDPGGITIQGNMVLINSGGSPGTIPTLPKEMMRITPGAVDSVPRAS